MTGVQTCALPILLFIAVALAAEPKVHKGTIKREEEKITSKVDQTLKSMKFYHNHFEEEASEAKHLLTKTKKQISAGETAVTRTIDNILLNKLKEVRTLHESAPNDAISKVEVIVKAFEKDLENQKNVQNKKLKTDMAKFVSELDENEKTLAGLEATEKQQYDSATSTITKMGASAKESLSAVMNQPEKKGDLREMAIQITDGTVKVKQSYRVDEHKLRRQAKAAKRNVRDIKENAKKEFDTYKETMKATISNLFTETKAKIKNVISLALEKSQENKLQKELNSQQVQAENQQQKAPAQQEITQPNNNKK